MLPRSQVLLIAGLLLLAVGTLIPLLIHRAHRGQALFPLMRLRLRMKERAVKLLRRCLMLRSESTSSSMLHHIAQPLQESLLLLRQELRRLPPLPAAESEPRLMPLARSLASQPMTADSLQAALEGCGLSGISGDERLAFPLCAAAAQAERLQTALLAILEDEHDRRRAARLFRRLQRHKRPISLLSEQPLSLAALAALLNLFRRKDASSLQEAVLEWLDQRGLDASSVEARQAQRQLALADELQEINACLQALRMMDWSAAAEKSDPLHRLLLDDPSGLYPRMTMASRAALRSRAVTLARWFHTAAGSVAAAALALSQEAEPRSLEQHVGYYLCKRPGLLALRKRLCTRRGLLQALLTGRRQLMLRAAYWAFSICFAFPFLNADHPLTLLPFFLIVIGCVPRAMASRLMSIPKPAAVTVSTVTPELRTLVVLPAELNDPQEGLRMLRRLYTSSHAFPADGVDFLLLGDHPEKLSQISAADAAVHAAVSTGVSSLCAETSAARFLYLHRARAWSQRQSAFVARGGRTGAVETVCRLIAQGECSDLFDQATFPPNQLYRRYAFVLLLDGDARPIPGMLEALLSAAAHPFSTRIPTPEGMRGYSCFRPCTQDAHAAEASGIRLIRPDAYLEAVDGLLSDDEPGETRFLCDALAGCRTVPDAHALSSTTASLTSRISRSFRRHHRLWLLARWLAPWVSTPSGVIRNPLSGSARTGLRERLRESALPVCQCILLLWALLRRDIPLMLLALFLPACFQLLRSDGTGIHGMLQACILLPFRASMRVFAAFRAALVLAGRDPSASAPPESWALGEVWCQGIASALCFILGVALPPLWMPALLPAALFALFPLLRMKLHDPAQPLRVLPNDSAPQIAAIAAATWRFFQDSADSSPASVPPAEVQTDPPCSAPAAVSPESTAMYMLAALSAKELELISAAEAGSRLAQAHEALLRMPMPLGLPCRRYSMDCTEAVDASVDTRACGLLLAALMTAAQALRSWLPQLPASLYELPARLDAFADALDILRLYDRSAGLFFAQLDEDGCGKGLLAYHADEGLLLSLAACARRIVPPQHFMRLSRTCAEAAGDALPLSEHGDLAAYLTPALFLPLDLHQADKVVQLNQKYGMRGLWGRSGSAVCAFTPELQYRQSLNGLREIAAEDVHQQAVFAPYAAALAMVCAPEAAAGSLLAMQQLGAFGPHGFCDAIDLTDEVRAALTQTRIAWHQGLLLCACAHVLADTPLQRYFCAIPQVEACLPLLDLKPSARVTLPPRPIRAESRSRSSQPERIMRQLCAPLDAQLLGDGGASIAINAAGSGHIRIGGLPITRFTGAAAMLEGVQLYLVDDEQRPYRLTDSSLPGQTFFTDHAVRFVRNCGSLRSMLTVLVDPGGRRILHLLEITNLATTDRTIDAADCLLPDLAAAPGQLEALHPGPQHLILHDRATGTTLHHRFDCSAAIESSAVCSDAEAFRGCGRTLRDPASLNEPLADLMAAGEADCLSFRLRFRIGGRGQVRILFSTGLTNEPLPGWQALSGLEELSRLHAEAIAYAVPLSPEAAATAAALTGPLLWQGQPHQGGAFPADAEPLLPFLIGNEPLLTLTIPDKAALPLFEECLSCTAWFRLKGQPVTLCALCTEETLPMAEAAMQISSLADHHAAVHLLPDPAPALRDAIFAASRIVLHGDGGAPAAQLEALRTPIRQAMTGRPPRPGQLPAPSLINPGGYGGFDPESGDYIVLLDSQQTPPRPWHSRHQAADFRFLTSVNGLPAPYDERLTLQMEGSPSFSLLNPALPRMIRLGGSVAQWQVFAADFRVTLKTSALSGHTAALRSLRIRDLTGQGLRITLNVSMALSTSPLRGLTALSDAVIASGAAPMPYAACATGEWQTAIVPTLLLPDCASPSASAAQLTTTLNVPANGSAEASWIVGLAQEAEDVVRAQLYIQTRGSSAAFHEALQAQADALPPLSIETPEPTLDLLVNHVLPRQLFSAASACAAQLPVLLLTSPADAKARLLEMASNPTDTDAALTIALMTGVIMQRTGDASLLTQRLPDGRTLQTLCRDTLMSVQAMPYRCFFAAAAAKLLSAFDDELHELHRSLLNNADIRLWQGDHYGNDEPLQLHVQSWAALAYGNTPRTKRALQTSWDMLYDPVHGLIRHQLPEESASVCPGLPGNGGQDTLSAVWYLASLAHLGHDEQAWELLRALNPLHHCDSPLRSEACCGAPWILAEGMEAAPASAGRAAEGPGDEAAAWLYTIIVCQLLGIVRDGDGVLLKPRVPAAWEEFTVTLRTGAATWRITFERGLGAMAIDGLSASGSRVTLQDDGRIHQVHAPLI